jgi:hypothetical protein
MSGEEDGSRSRKRVRFSENLNEVREFHPAEKPSKIPAFLSRALDMPRLDADPMATLEGKLMMAAEVCATMCRMPMLSSNPVLPIPKPVPSTNHNPISLAPIHNKYTMHFVNWCLQRG